MCVLRTQFMLFNKRVFLEEDGSVFVSGFTNIPQFLVCFGRFWVRSGLGLFRSVYSILGPFRPVSARFGRFWVRIGPVLGPFRSVLIIRYILSNGL